MNVIFTKSNPLPELDIVQVFRPSRGIGGTLSYAVNVNGQIAVYEMNDECVWETKCIEKPLAQKVLQLVTPLFDSRQY